MIVSEIIWHLYALHIHEDDTSLTSMEILSRRNNDERGALKTHIIMISHF